MCGFVCSIFTRIVFYFFQSNSVDSCAPGVCKAARSEMIKGRHYYKAHANWGVGRRTKLRSLLKQRANSNSDNSVGYISWFSLANMLNSTPTRRTSGIWRTPWPAIHQLVGFGELNSDPPPLSPRWPWSIGVRLHGNAIRALSFEAMGDEISRCEAVYMYGCSNRTSMPQLPNLQLMIFGFNFRLCQYASM